MQYNNKNETKIIDKSMYFPKKLRSGNIKHLLWLAALDTYAIMKCPVPKSLIYGKNIPQSVE